MPRYYFHSDGENPPADHEGTEFPSTEEALGEALLAMADMLRDLDGRLWNGDEWRMTVTDERGGTICTLAFRGTRGPLLAGTRPGK